VDNVLNIALIANTCWNINNFRVGLIKHLIAQGHNVFVLAPKDDTTPILIKKIPKLRFIALNSLSRKGTNPIQDYKLIKEIKRIYLKYQIDIALQYTIKPNVYGSIAAASLKTKTISNVTGLGFAFLNKSIKTSLIRNLFKKGLAKSNLIVFQNKADFEELTQRNYVDAQKAHIILGSGVDTQVFKPSTIDKSGSEFVFLFIGRLLYDKGVSELVEAFNLLSEDYPNVVLKLIGALDIGNPSAISEAQLKEWLYQNKNIKYLGLSNNLPEIIAPVDCVVLPSYREGLPKSLLEAMSMAKPIITTNVPGCSQLIDEGKNGILCEARNVLSLFEALRHMVKLQVNSRESMGQHGRSLVEQKYDEQIIVKEYDKLIAQLLAG
jgi:glycosyltransferase involved in cell wall biosynthesis